MLYTNTKTGKFGVTFGEIRKQIPAAILVKNANVIGDWNSYEEVPPPHINEFQKVKEIAPIDGVQQWEVINPDNSPESIATVKEILKDRITDQRWVKETSGLTLPNGISVATKKDDLDRMNSVITNAERAGITSFDFKATSGWVSITLQEFYGLSIIISHFIQRCFSLERTYHERVDALETVEELMDFNNLTLGWHIDLTDLYAHLAPPQPEPEEDDVGDAPTDEPVTED